MEESDRTKAAEEFKSGLRTAVERRIQGNYRALSSFFETHKPPEAFCGNSDRTNWFFQCTTVLKTFGELEGLKFVYAMSPNDYDGISTAVLVVFDKKVREIDREIARDLARKRLAVQCEGVIESLEEVMTLEDNAIMQHSLISLRGDCKWCVSAFGEKANNGGGTAC